MKNRRILFIAFLVLLAGKICPAKFTVNVDPVGQRYPFSYVRVHIINNTNLDMKYDISIKDGYNRGNLEINDFEIRRGAEKYHHLAIPVAQLPQITVEDSLGDRHRVGYSSNSREVLYIAGMESWLSQKELTDLTSRLGLPREFISQVEPEMLPENWLCFCPFRSVVIEESDFRLLGQGEKSALMRWVRSGGELRITRAGENEEQKTLLGTVIRTNDDPLTTFMQNLQKIRRHQLGWESYSDKFTFPYDVEGSSGYMGGFLLATFFLIAAGPVNYIYFRRKKRIRMLLISLPVISIAFCLLIILHFVGTQGFSKKGGTVSLSVLDENTDGAVTLGAHSIYSGLYPFGGFQFSAKTSFYPLKKEKDYTIDMTTKLHLKSGLFKPSSNFYYFTATPYETREKIVYNKEDRTVTNGFEQDLTGLVLMDGDQTFKVGAIAAGEKKALEPVAEMEDPLDFAGNFLLENKEDIFFQRYYYSFAKDVLEQGEVKYLLRFKENQPSADPGTKINSGGACSLLAGISS